MHKAANVTLLSGVLSATTFGAYIWTGARYMNQSKASLETDWSYTDKNGDGWFDPFTEIDRKVSDPVLVTDFADFRKPFSEWDTAELHTVFDMSWKLSSVIFAASVVLLLYQLCNSPAYKAFKARLRLTGKSE